MALKPDWKVGFSTGLRYWLFFMISLFILGYGTLFCILIGFTGAIATGIIFAWWYPKEDEDAPAPAPVPPKEAGVPEPPPKRPLFQRYGAKGKRRQSIGIRRFGWLFKRK